MTDIRIKDLPSDVPNGSESVAFDSTGTGTKQNSITELTDVGNQTIPNPIIGTNSVGNLTTIRTGLEVAGNAVLDLDIRVLGTASMGIIKEVHLIEMISGSDGSGNPYAYIAGKTIADGSTLVDSEHWLTISGSRTLVSGSGGTLKLAGGDGGLSPSQQGFGGTVQLLGGSGGDCIRGPAQSGASVGGDINAQGGNGGNSAFNFNAGTGGNFSFYGGSGGSITFPTGSATAGNGGSVLLGGGNGGFTAATGSGGAGGSLQMSAGGGGGSYAGYGGDGGALLLIAGNAGQGSSQKPFHSGSTISRGGDVAIIAGSPSPAFVGYTSGSAGAITISGGQISKQNRYISGSIMSIGNDVISTADASISRLIINAGSSPATDNFPGTDIFLHVSGTKLGKVSGTLGSVANFGGDVLISGSTYREGQEFFVSRITTGNTTVAQSDFGNVLCISQSVGGPVTASLTPGLSGSFGTGRAVRLTIIFEHTGSLSLVSCSGGVTINGVITPLASTGANTVVLTSRNGFSWFR